MPKKTLSDLLANARGEPIEYEGRMVHGIYRCDVHPGNVLRVRFVRASSSVRQGLSLSIKKGQLAVEGQTMRRLVLWTDTAPSDVEIVCRPPKSGAVLHVWNNWDRDGVMMAWLGNAGILVEPGHGAVVLKCSDGVGPPDFEDLVVELRLERRPKVLGVHEGT